MTLIEIATAAAIPVALIPVIVTGLRTFIRVHIREAV